MGIHPQIIVPPKNRKWEYAGVRRASGDDRHASWHISVDADGSAACHLDLRTIKAYHCGQCNPWSVGIEMYQGADGSITEETLDSTVLICDVITRELSIQRQFPSQTAICTRLARPTRGGRRSSRLAYLPGGKAGEDFVGLFGHRNATRNRGPGDPGDLIWDKLGAAGYEEFNIDTNEDIRVWKARQEALVDKGLYRGNTVDGIPGPGTNRALRCASAQRPSGIWIPRPGDGNGL